MIVVTGANGFIGRNLVLALLAAGQPVVGVDRKPAADPGEVAGADYVEELFDLGDRERLAGVLQKHGCTTLIALAETAESPVKGIVAQAARALTALLDMAADAGVSRVCIASSITVYMGLTGPHREDMALPVETSLHISALKKAEELVGQWYANNSALEIVAMRLANIYGPRYHSMMNTPSRYLFAALGRTIAARARIGDDIYRQIADFCHVEDCARGIALIATSPTLRHRIYNIASGRGVTDADIARAVERAVGRNEVAALEEGSDNHMDISRIRDELGYVPRYDIVSGMAAYRQWLASNDI